MKQLPVWLAYAIERLPLISSFYEIRYGAHAAFIQLRRNHDKKDATGKQIAKAIAGALLHDILNPLRIVDATVRTVLNLANLALAPFYAIKNLLSRKSVWFKIALSPLRALVWFAKEVLLAVGLIFQSWVGRQRLGMSYEYLKSTMNYFNLESKIKTENFFNAMPQPETMYAINLQTFPHVLWKQVTSHIYAALGIKSGRLEHLANKLVSYGAEMIVYNYIHTIGTMSQDEYNEAVRLQKKYAEEDVPNPGLIYGLADAPYQLVAAATRAVERKFDTKLKADSSKPVAF
jgi:hypothetical protein